MTTETFRSLTQETVHIYARTAKTVVRTYRVGAHRAVGGFSRRLGAAGGRVERPVADSFVNVGQKFAALVEARVDTVASTIDGAIDTLAKGASQTLGSFAGAADKFYRTLPTRAARVFTQVNMPAVRMSRDLAAQISRGAESVAKRVGGEAGKAAAKPARRTAVRKAARPAAAKRVRKAAKAA
jgi:hypothetical protein